MQKRTVLFTILTAILVAFVLPRPVLAQMADLAWKHTIGLRFGLGNLDVNRHVGKENTGFTAGLDYVCEPLGLRATFERYDQKGVSGPVYFWGGQYVYRQPLVSAFYVEAGPGLYILHQEETQFDITGHMALGMAILSSDGCWVIDMSIPAGFYPNRNRVIQNTPHTNIGFAISVRRVFDAEGGQ